MMNNEELLESFEDKKYNYRVQDDTFYIIDNETNETFGKRGICKLLNNYHEKLTKKEIIDSMSVDGDTILSIKVKPVPLETNDGINLNEGYEFIVNGAIPQLADAISKMALEMPKNGFGDNSDAGFITLINEFYKKSKENK